MQREGGWIYIVTNEDSWQNGEEMRETYRFLFWFEYKIPGVCIPRIFILLPLDCYSGRVLFSSLGKIPNFNFLNNIENILFKIKANQLLEFPAYLTKENNMAC